MLERVSRARGLAARAVPALVSLSEAELTRAALQRVRRSTPEVARSATEGLLSRLELVPDGFEWLAALEQALRGRLLAFYDPDRQSIFIDETLTGSSRRRALVHELVHALQDQHFGLGARLTYAPEAWDQQNALHTIAEGDAEALTARWAPAAPDERLDPAADSPAASGGGGAQTRPEAPGVLLRSLSAAYVDGRAFVEPILARAGFEAVNALLLDPPRTTHELLHPTRAPPEPLLRWAAPARPPGSDWRLTYTDLLGEQTWRCVLAEWLPRADAERTAGGWLGDRLSVYERGGGTALVWHLRTEASAHAHVAKVLSLQFSATAHPATESASATPPLAAAAAHGFVCRAHRDRGVVGVLSGTHDLWFVSLDDPASAAATCHALASWAARLRGGE